MGPTWAMLSPQASYGMCALSRFSCVQPPGSSVHRILQARILERVAMSSSRGSSRPRDRTASLALWMDSLPTE